MQQYTCIIQRKVVWWQMDKSSNKILTKMDLIKTWLTWISFAQTNYNYERLQGLGFCHTMSIIIKKLYKTKEDISEALTRHLTFFNTESTWGSIIVGISAALEEEKAANKDMNPEIINNLKTSLMGPMAGIGDSVTQGIVKIVLLGIGIDLAMQGNALGPILFVLLFTVYTVGLSYFLFFSGYNIGKNAVVKLLSTDLTKSFTDSLKIMSMMVVGALGASSIKTSTSLIFKFGGTTVELQKVLDQIFPKMIPLAILMLAFYLLKEKRKSPTYVLITLFVIGFATSLLSIFA